MTAVTDKAQIVVSTKAQPLHPVTREIADNLAGISVMRLVKVNPGFLQASSEVVGSRRIPVTKPGHPSAIAVR